MKSLMNFFFCSSLLLLSISLTSCITETKSPKDNQPVSQDSLESAEMNKAAVESAKSATLPIKYQTASYMVEKQGGKEDLLIADEGKLKVEARITSTRGPQPLWDILKRLAALKGMNVSWASDVDQNVLVDVNINANDDFFGAIDNLLRQVDYYHEVQGSTIVIKYKETRQFHIAMPFIKQTYKTKTGGDVLGGGASSSNIAGEISLASEGVAINDPRDGKAGGIEFNTWNSIENNLNAVLSIWSADSVTSDSYNSGTGVSRDSRDDKSSNKEGAAGKVSEDSSKKSTSSTNLEKKEEVVSATFRRSKSGNSYFIDKPVGLITVTCPRPLLEKLELYFKSLQKELYKQVSIEAKILEVQLDDNSSIGLNWNLILKNLSVAGASLIGGKTYSNQKLPSGTYSTYSSKDLTNTDNVSNTTTGSGTKTYVTVPLPASGDSLTADSGSLTTANVLTTAATSLATSGVSAATILTEGVTGGLGGTISLAAFTFDSFLNAVSEQGKATILSNPKLSVLNGQPALITVGRNVTYINKITSDVSETGVITYSAETARALSGVGLALTANILDDKQIILNLVPVTSELIEPIDYRSIGLGSVGLPIINVREMSTTVRVNNGEMLVIGGLIASVTENDGTFVPGTSNLGFFKYLFGYEKKLAKKRELIILLKPRII